MNNEEKFKLFIYESMYNGSLDECVGNQILELHQESFFQSPVKACLEKLKKIKNARPNEFSGPKEVKEYVDKYYDDILYISSIVEENPEKLRNFNFKHGLAIAAEIIVAYALLMPATLAFTIPGIILLILAIVHSLIVGMKNVLHKKSDNAALSDLAKIKTALTSILKRGANTECKSKISTVINEISAAESEMKRQEKDDIMALAAASGNVGVKANFNF